MSGIFNSVACVIYTFKRIKHVLCITKAKEIPVAQRVFWKSIEKYVSSFSYHLYSHALSREEKMKYMFGRTSKGQSLSTPVTYLCLIICENLPWIFSVDLKFRTREHLSRIRYRCNVWENLSIQTIYKVTWTSLDLRYTCNGFDDLVVSKFFAIFILNGYAKHVYINP